MTIKIGYAYIFSMFLVYGNAYAMKFDMQLWSDAAIITFIENNVYAVHDSHEFLIKALDMRLKSVPNASWNLLQMAPTSNMKAVKNKYYALARAAHPDRNQENLNQMAQISEAYRTITAKPSFEVLFVVKENKENSDESHIRSTIDVSFDEIKSKLTKKMYRSNKTLLEAGNPVRMDTSRNEGRNTYLAIKDLISPCNMVLQDIPPVPTWGDLVKSKWHYALGALGLVGAGYAAYRYYQTK